jgi:hypothetical protein
MPLRPPNSAKGVMDTITIIKLIFMEHVHMIVTEINHYAKEFHNSMEAYFLTDQLLLKLTYKGENTVGLYIVVAYLC